MSSYKYEKFPISHVKNLEDFEHAKSKIPFIKNYYELINNRSWNYFHRAEYLHYIEESFQEIFDWIKEWKNILILPDYDSDWTNSWFMYYNFLTLLKWILNSTSEIKIKPTCRDEWYWISEEFFNSSIHDWFDIILTTDIWISVQFPFEFIRDKKVLIFDHHLPLTSIWFSIKEIREYIKNEIPDFDFNKKSFDNQEEKEKIVKMCILKLQDLYWWSLNLQQLKEFTNNLKVNNFVLNYYDNYFSWFQKEKDQFTLKNREEFKKLDINKDIKDEYDIHFYSSAWELSSIVIWYYLEKLVNMWLVDESFLKFKNIYLIWWCITSITDITNLESKNNLAFFVYWSECFNIIRKKYNWLRPIFFNQEDTISNVIWELFFKEKRIKTNKDFEKLIQSKILFQWFDKNWIASFANQIISYLKFFLWFDTDLNKISIWFTIWPYINSFWRLITTHSLFEQMILWKKMNKKINEKRKNMQSDITKNIQDDIIRDKRNLDNENSNNIIIWWIKHWEDQWHKYRLLKKYYTQESTIFSDYIDELETTEEINEKISIEQIEDSMVTNLWVVWIIASKIQEEYNQPAIVWEYYDDTCNSIHWSWRSKLSLFDLWVWTFKSVTSIWWHWWAFWIDINDVELFKKEYNEKLNSLWEERVKELYKVEYDMLIEVSTFEEYDKIIEELQLFEWMIDVKVSFKEMLKWIYKDDVNCMLFFNNQWAQFSFYWKNTTYKTWKYKLTFWEFFDKNYNITVDDMIDCLYTKILPMWSTR